MGIVRGVAAVMLSFLSGTAAAGAPRLLVLSKSDAALEIMDPASGKVLGRVATGESPHELAVSSDGRFAFVANYGSRTPGNSISVIDLGARKETRRVQLGLFQRPHGIAFADGKVYFTAEANKVIARYDPAADRVDWVLGTGQNGTHMILISPDGTRMFTANIGSDSITVMDQASNGGGWNETVVAVGKGPEGIDLTPDGKELWAAHSRDGGVSIVDVVTKRVVGTLNIATKRSNRLKFTPDGKYALVSDMEGGEVVVIDRAARKEVKRIAVGRAPEGILMQPDGSRAFVAVSGDNQVAVIELGTLAVTSRMQTGAGPDGMAWVEAR
jgi:YVTN family beta-propeller protein